MKQNKKKIIGIILLGVFIFIFLFLIHMIKHPMGQNLFGYQWAINTNVNSDIYEYFSDNGVNDAYCTGYDIGIESLWGYSAQNYSDKEIIIAVIDTGVDYRHIGIRNNIWVNSFEIDGDGVDNDGNGYVDDVYGWNFIDNSSVVYESPDDDGHGTMIAGIIGADGEKCSVKGICRNISVKIQIIKVSKSSKHYCDEKDLIQAIQYAENNGAQICNVSMTLKNATDQLKRVMSDSKMLFVVAAGNGTRFGGKNIDQYKLYPASYDLDNVITVAGVSWNGELLKTSNYGENSVDVSAPGLNVYSTYCENQYAYDTGTSFAAPIVTGICAYILVYVKNCPAQEVKKILLLNSRNLSSLNGFVTNGNYIDADLLSAWLLLNNH